MKNIKKTNKETRFIEVYKEDTTVFGTDKSLIVDKKTGVTYLIICNTYGTGITPLLNIDGKPVITKLDNDY